MDAGWWQYHALHQPGQEQLQELFEDLKKQAGAEKRGFRQPGTLFL